MKLTDAEFVRSLALIEGLRIIEEKANDRGGTLPELTTEGIKALQAFTVAKGNQYATQLPDVYFPDETERETPESLAQFEASQIEVI